MLRATEVVPDGDLRSRVPDAMTALRLIERCLPHDPGPAGVERDRAVRDKAERRPDDNIFVPSTLWEDAVTADQAVLLATWPDDPGTRWVLSFAEQAAYARLANAVVDNALDRFAVGG